MKSNRGVTITSMVVYTVGLIIIIAIVRMTSSYVSSNANLELLKDTSQEYTKFSSVFLKEINKKGNKVLACNTYSETGSDGKQYKVSYILFSSGNQYTYMGSNKTIYQNNIKICERVNNCDFYCSDNVDRYSITVNFETDKTNMSGENAITYNLEK